MAIAFPNSPTNGQTVTVGNLTYSWSSSENAWLLVTTVATGPTGPTGATGPIGKFVTSDTAPTSPVSGDAWFNSNRGKTYVYYNDGDSSQWVQIGSAQAGAPGVANRNVILNSAFDIWQRGTTVTNPSNGSILADRWLMIYDGTGLTKTVSRQTFTPGSAPIAGVEEAQYFIRTAQTVAGSGATYNVYQTRIEDARVLAGQTATVSFYARAGSTITLPNVNVQQVFGSGGSPQTFNVIASVVSVGTSWNRYSYTFTMPSITGKTLGTNSFLVFEIGMPLNSTYTFDLWGVQLEAGSVATPFQRNGANIQAELASCQRYYTRFSASAAYSSLSLQGFAASTTLALVRTQLPVTMRVAPTAIDFSTLGLLQTNGVDIAVSSAVLAGRTTANSVEIETTSTGLTADRGYALIARNSSTAFLGFSAEL
jgi:hypothetical protein